MSDQHPSDELQFDVEDLRPLPKQPGICSTARSLLYPSRTRRQRMVRRLLAASLLILVVAVMLAGVPALRLGLADLVRPLLPAPTPALAPGANRFFFVPSPPGVDVLVDGHTLASPPLLGDPHPLDLSRGRHTLLWRSTRLPFQPLRCVVSVPANPADTCPSDPVSPGVPGATGVAGYVITLHPSLAKASDSLLAHTLTTQGANLLSTIYDAIATMQFTTVVQPGEHYYLDAPSPHVAIAAEPLRATLSYASGSLLAEPCTLAPGILPCRFPDQDCTLLCTLPPPLAAAGSPDDWIAATGLRPSWTYTTLDDRMVAPNVADPITTQLIILRISWDGTQWRVAPITSHIAALPATDDAACDSARALLAGTTWGFMLSGPPPGAFLRVAPGATPADGCAVEVVNHGTPDPVFLAHCGVLLTVNDQAINPVDTLPRADAAEQRLALRLLSTSTSAATVARAPTAPPL